LTLCLHEEEERYSWHIDEGGGSCGLRSLAGEKGMRVRKTDDHG
jgi:hypothetical protein